MNNESSDLLEVARQFLLKSVDKKYSYNFSWLSRPIIQYPQDILAVQQLLWQTKPDLVIETGIARGGSLVFYASILDILARCGGPTDASVSGIDIDIRDHNKKMITNHPMFHRIEMIEGSSTSPETIAKVKQRATKASRVFVCLDSNHTHEHVLKELQSYGPLVTQNSYMIVFDTVVEKLPNALSAKRPWCQGNNPKTAILEYLQKLEEDARTSSHEKKLQFEVDNNIDNQLLISVAPGGYLKRTG